MLVAQKGIGKGNMLQSLVQYYTNLSLDFDLKDNCSKAYKLKYNNISFDPIT